MPSIKIRNLDGTTNERLRLRAARQHHSMEEEALHILRAALAGEGATPRNLAQSIRDRIRAGRRH